jgi:D-3-phosphoglycerate dehydrogenase / 2-oxoglutarate reductase
MSTTSGRSPASSAGCSRTITSRRGNSTPAEPEGDSARPLTVAVSVSSFAEEEDEPLERLRATGVRILRNPHKRTLSEDEAAHLIADADGLMAGTEPLTRPVLEEAGRLRVISRVGVGMDNIDLRAAARFGIAVFNTPDAVTDAAAEMTVGGIIAVLRHLRWMDSEVRAGRWSKKMGRLLREKTVGVIGMGRVGKRVITLLQPFGVRVLAHDLSPDRAWARANGVALTTLDLLAASDVVTIHASKAPGAGPIVGPREIGLVKWGAIVVHTARGGLVDEQALVEALRDGQLGGAFLDVYGEEPFHGQLCELPNVLLTPHAGPYATEARVRMEVEAVNQLLGFLIGGVGP